MNNNIYLRLERLGNLLRNEARSQGQELGLLPVQHDALHYLSVCNRYSDTPLAVAEYLGLTKGTVSQTLNVLESKGLVDKIGDPKDKRVVHLKLTRVGSDYLKNTVPPAGFVDAVTSLSEPTKRHLERDLSFLLLEYQKVSGRKGFGVCKGCAYNLSDKSGFVCGLTHEDLSKRDIELICREFTNQVAE